MITIQPYIQYFQSPLGLMAIRADEQAICQVHFIDKKEMPPRENELTRNCILQLAAYFEGELRTFSLPLQQKGTPFQQKVWKNLLDIPYGKTATYKEMAIKMGNLRSIRAAAAANGKNDIAIIVPCHRVIGSNNALIGYAGGLWRKKWLLAHENKIAGGVQTLF